MTNDEITKAVERLRGLEARVAEEEAASNGGLNSYMEAHNALDDALRNEALPLIEALVARIAELEANVTASRAVNAAACSAAEADYRRAEEALRDRAVERAEAAEQALAAKWQPIATAPKDGTRVLIHVPGWSSTAVVGWLGLSGTTRVYGSDCDVAGATHWMPFPSPPTGEQR